MLFGIAADMPAPKPAPEDTLYADIEACDDMARLAIHGHARPETWAKLAGYLRELNRLRTDAKAAFHELGGIGHESSKEFHRIGIDSAREILRRALDRS